MPTLLASALDSHLGSLKKLLIPGSCSPRLGYLLINPFLSLEIENTRVP